MTKSYSVRLLMFIIVSIGFACDLCAQSSDPYAVWNREAPKPRWANFFTDSIPSEIGVYTWNIDQRLSAEDYWLMARDGIRWPFVKSIEVVTFYSYDQIAWYYFDDAAWDRHESACWEAYWAGQPPPPTVNPMIYMGTLPDEVCAPCGS